MPSKLSIHLSGYPNKTFDVLTKMQPSVVKVFNQNSEMNIDTIRQMSPNTIIMFRQYTNLDYHSSADTYFAEISESLNKLHGRGILWEGINEPIVNTIDDAKALNAWWVRFAQLMHARGELVAGFSWSTGNPTDDKLSLVVQNVAEAATACDVHAFHEYYKQAGEQVDWGKYRAFEQALPASARKPVVITEAGWDDNGDPTTGGYKGKVSAQQYLDILKAYDAVLLQDPYVLGATVFEWGDFNWSSFELDSMIDLFANYVASVGGGVVIPKPWPLPVFGPPPPPPATCTFTASPTSITAGQSATLKWDCDLPMNQITLDNQVVTNHGTKVVTPTATTTYTLRIFLKDGTIKTLTSTVAVTAPGVVHITSVSITPSSLAPGDTLNVSIVVQNDTNATLQTQQPNPGFVYDEGDTFVSRGFDSIKNAYRVGVDFDGRTGIDHPYRWGLGASLAPGQSATITGSVKLKTPRAINYWAGLVDEFMNWVEDKKGTQLVTITAPTNPKPNPNLTRPPTVVITPENVAQLKTYPRPTNDNGRGLHFNIDLRDSTNANTVAHLQSINARWTMIYAQDEHQGQRAAQAAWSAGILPVLRIGKKVDQFFDPVAYVNALKSVGAPPYVQIYNEPGDNREWNNWPGDNWVGIFAARWAQAAIAVYDAGGYPGLQVLSVGEFNAAIDSVKAQGRADIFQRAFFVVHNYGSNHPPAYPYDARNQQDHPGATIFDDDTAVLVLLEIAKWMQDRIGFVLPIIGGEGGWEFGAQEDNRYPKVEQPYHANYHKEIFDWFRTGVLSNGEPLPDYLFSITPWIEGGWGADDWWGGPLGTKTDTINAVTAIPSFVRKFSWDLGGVSPGTVSFTATPASISPGQSSTLQWSTTNASAVTLDGQSVATSGTKNISPTQTQTFSLHVDFVDGSKKDLGATVTVSAGLPPRIDWDARLTDLGVNVDSSTAAQAWRLIAAKYQNENESGGNHNVYFKMLNSDGTPAPGIKLVVDWKGRDTGDAPAVVTTDGNGEANCALWAVMHPEKKDGPYFTFVKDAPSERVNGMGLPVARHVNFLLTFKLQ